MLQERIVGPGVGVFACYRDGRPVALFSHRRLRERPPWGGVSVLSRERAAASRARASTPRRLLDELGWHGVAMVEFKQDVRDGIPKLMEINGRFWGSLQLAIDAGVDFPALLVRGVEPTRVEPQAPYRSGSRADGSGEMSTRCCSACSAAVGAPIRASWPGLAPSWRSSNCAAAISTTTTRSGTTPAVALRDVVMVPASFQRRARSPATSADTRHRERDEVVAGRETTVAPGADLRDDGGDKGERRGVERAGSPERHQLRVPNA